MAAGNASSSNSAVELTSDVNTAVEKLEELRAELSRSKTVFSDEFCMNSAAIVTVLGQLDTLRLKAHDKLEVETIRASVLRHKLNKHASRLRNEAAMAVKSARESNEAQVQELKDKLDQMNAEASQLMKKHEVLDLHNDRIQTEIKSDQVQHDGKMKLLNTKISERTSIQILLNETSDQLQTTNDEINRLENEMADLEKTLVSRREEFNSEKNQILKTLDVTKVKLNEANMENFRLKKELGNLEDEAVESGLALQESNREINETETVIERLMKNEEDIKAAISEAEKENTRFTDIGKGIEEEVNTMEEDFKHKRKEKERTIQLLMKEVEQCKEENVRLKDIRKKIKKDLKGAQDKKNSQSSSLADIKRSVDASKKLLQSESEAGVRLQAEKKELDFRLQSLQETHRATVQLLKEEMMDLKEKLTKERKTRETVEDSYNALQCEIQEQLMEHSEVMSELANERSEAEGQESKMTEKTEQLQTELATYEQNITSLSQELTSTTNRLNFTEEDLEEKITRLEESIADLSEERFELQEQLAQLEPETESLEDTYSSLSVSYEEKKREMITMKNRKAGLEDICTRLEKELAKMNAPVENLRMSTLSCRAYARQVLREQEKKVRSMECEVEDREEKLENIEKENRRFKESMENLIKDHDHLLAMYDRSRYLEHTMRTSLSEIREKLEVEWSINQELTEQYCDIDRNTLLLMEECDSKARDRLALLSSLSTQFDTELQKLSEYLKHLARPDTSSVKKSCLS